MILHQIRHDFRSLNELRFYGTAKQYRSCPFSYKGLIGKAQILPHVIITVIVPANRYSKGNILPEGLSIAVTDKALLISCQLPVQIITDMCQLMICKALLSPDITQLPQ